MTDAELVNGNTILRVKDTSQDVGVGFILEAHYFLKDITYDFTAGLFGARAPGGCKGVPNPLNCTEFANGPFVAVEIGGGTKATTDAGPITGYALGWMIGLHHPVLDAKGKDTSTSSWNFGVGLRIDPQAQVLGDGFVPNQPPPAGETAVRFKKETRYGVMLLSSFSF